MHGEGDGLPSLVVDRYDRWLVVQLMSAGLERSRDAIVRALVEVTGCAGILARHDAAVRTREGLPRETALLHGDVPREIEIVEHGVRYLAAPWTGQKTGAFLDQRENRALVGRVARGRALDCFSYHGSFALHLARGATDVLALDVSTDALARAHENAARNGITHLRRARRTPSTSCARRSAPARATTRSCSTRPRSRRRARRSAGAMRGYKDVNLRAMRLLAPGGLLFTASCSYHLTKPLFLEMLEAAAADSGRRIALREFRGQPLDHPELLDGPGDGLHQGRAARGHGLTAAHGRTVSAAGSAAEVRRAARLHEASDRSAAPRARLALAPVDVQPLARLAVLIASGIVERVARAPA